MCSIEYETARWPGCREFGFSKLNCSAAAAGKGPRTIAHPPSNISTSMGLNLLSFKFSINRQASFESYRTTIQLLWSIPNITLVPNPHPYTDSKATFKVPAAPFPVDRVSRLLSTNRNLYFVLILIQTRMQQKIRLRWTLTHCLRTGNWT